jgi:hypothetical protein
VYSSHPHTKKAETEGIAIAEYLYRIGRERRAKQAINFMNPKSYSVLIGPTKAQEEDGLASSDMHVFSNYKSAMTYLNEEVKRQEKGERLWVRLNKYEHLHDKNGRWYDDKQSVLVTVYV